MTGRSPAEHHIEANLVSFAMGHAETGAAPPPALRELIDRPSKSPGLDGRPPPGDTRQVQARSIYARLRHEFGVAPCTAELAAVITVACADAVGDRVSVGLAVGFEAGVRLADLIHEGTQSGHWHPAGTAATVGGALAAGVAHGLDQTGCSNAVGLATCQAAVIDIRNESSVAERAGWSAGAAVDAVHNAILGMTAPAGALTGRRGLLAVMGCSADPDIVFERLGDDWKSAGLLDITSKCRWHGTEC